jgi:hypothetical protein
LIDKLMKSCERHASVDSAKIRAREFCGLRRIAPVGGEMDSSCVFLLVELVAFARVLDYAFDNGGRPARQIGNALLAMR